MCVLITVYNCGTQYSTPQESTHKYNGPIPSTGCSVDNPVLSPVTLQITQLHSYIMSYHIICKNYSAPITLYKTMAALHSS